MNIPLLDLKAQYRAIQPEIDAAVAEVLAAQVFILGPTVLAFEQACGAYCGAAHAVGVSSGTDALLMALMAEGISVGDEVITSPYTFFATAGCIARLGARPVFVDIEPTSFNLDPHKIEQTITKRTKAIMPVHLYGRMAEMTPINAIARKHKLVVIEDACQAIGAEYQGCRAGAWGDYGCFSFFPSKNLGGAGDGGLLTTGDAARAAKLVALRNHGMEPKYYHKIIGGNFRLDALQAAVLHVKLRHLDAWTAARRRNATRYNQLFRTAGLAPDVVTLPTTPCAEAGRADGEPCHCHVFNQYVIRTPRRDALRAFLAERGVGSEVYYPVPLHLQECFRVLGHRAGDFPESERAANETLALPIYPELSDAQAECVVASIREFFKQ
ncbi:MAG: DegT/DnrJ/EryC1/StrS family aminotransferase [Verrucomicrobia bacterium]|nr:MAG: DegT/DnrJ/EryC1/StrS family aminotransferase [Verrucomicrobiota bacterium]